MPHDNGQGSGLGQPEKDKALPPVIEAEGVQARFLRFLANPENLSLIGAAVLFIGVLWIASESVEIAHTIKETVQALLVAACEAPANGAAGAGEVKPWFVAVVIFFLGVVFVAAVYALAMYFRARKLRSNLRECSERRSELAGNLQAATSERDHAKGALAQAATEKESLENALQKEREQSQQTRTALAQQLEGIVGETVRAVSKISRQMFPAIVGVKGKTFRHVRYTYNVSRDFSAEVHRRCTIRAGDAPLHLWVSSVNASSDAKPAATFADIQFRLMSRDINSDVVYLPAENDHFNKFACVFFLPPVPPGQEREVELNYCWTGLFLGLQRNGWEDFSYPLKSAGMIEEFELEAFLEDGTGGYLKASEIGLKLPGSAITAAANDRGWPGFRYRAANIQPELLSEEIVARVEWKRT